MKRTIIAPLGWWVIIVLENVPKNKLRYSKIVSFGINRNTYLEWNAFVYAFGL